jgi:hypothetical protein
MTAVNISGTFKKDSRTDNGLEAISDALVKDELARHVVVGIIELHKFTKEPGEAPRPVVHFVAIEPIDGQDGVILLDILNKARKTRHLGLVGETLFDHNGGEAGADEPDGDKADEPGVADTDRGRGRSRRGAAGSRADGGGEPGA